MRLSFYIKRNGKIEDGRTTDAVGAHCRGQNHDSIGVALVGGMDEAFKSAENNFTGEQWESLKVLIEELHQKYPDAKLRGHYHFNPDKQCPAFDVDEWAKTDFLWVEEIVFQMTKNNESEFLQHEPCNSCGSKDN